MTAFGSESDLELLARLVAQVSRSRTFPPPTGHERWCDDAVWDVVVDLVSAKGASLVLEARVAADDQGHLERRLLQTVKHFLIDQARSTYVGKVRGRLDTLLSADARFVKVPAAVAASSSWALAGSPGISGAGWHGDFDDLIAVAWNVSTPPRLIFPTSGPTPGRSRDAILAVADAVLEAAGGCVPEQILARVVAERFVYDLPATEDAAGFTDFGAEDVEFAGDGGPDDEVIANGIAQALWDALTGGEQSIIQFMGLPKTGRNKAVQSWLACGRYKADAVTAAVEARIRDHVGDAETGRRVLPLLTEIWREALEDD